MSHQSLRADVASNAAVILQIENVSKNYGPVIALNDVSMSIMGGTIHGLLGENGAGKSTLVGIISGQRKPSGGRVLMDGKPVDITGVKVMEDAGVFLVTQEPMIIGDLSTAENLLLGIWPTRCGLVDWKKLRADADRMLEGSGISPTEKAGKLDAVSRRKLNILRAMFSGGRVIILDEPTASLTVGDRDKLFDFMNDLKDEGVTFIFISHYNDEILNICDSVSVLRDGRMVGGYDDISSLTSEDLTELVLGRELELFQRARQSFRDAPIAVELRDVQARDVDLGQLAIAEGEIIGFTGLPGSGAKELGRTLFGLNGPGSGTLCFQGRDVPLPQSPREAFMAGIAFLSDDRRCDGAVGMLSIGQNIALSSLERRVRGGLVDLAAEARVIDHYFSTMGVKAPQASYAVDTLSGGNQQKVCLGRVLAAMPRLLIVDEPTRGIDIGVKQDVLRILDDLSREGVVVIIISTDTDELARVADRICIFSRGGIRQVVSGEEITAEGLRQLAQA